MSTWAGSRRSNRLGRVLATAAVVVGLSAVGVPASSAEPDGDLDVSFNRTGVAETVVVSDVEADDVTRAPDGSLLVLAGGDVWRFTAGGTFDPTFGVRGVLDLATTPEISPTGIEAMPDGRFVVGGFIFSNATAPTLGSARFLADGTLDPSFGIDVDLDGRADVIPELSIAQGPADAGAGAFLVVQSNGAVVVAGSVDTGGFGNSIVAGRFTPDGTASNTEVFASPGGVSGTFRTLDATSTLADRILLAIGGQNDNTVTVARLEADLDPDPSFGGDGFDVQPGDDVFTVDDFRIAGLADGSVALTAAQLGELDGVWLFRWSPTGRLLGRTGSDFDDAVDLSFPAALTALGDELVATVSAIDTDADPQVRTIEVVRFDIGGDEVARGRLATSGVQLDAAAAVADADDAVVIAGLSQASAGERLLLTRVTRDAEIDDSFGATGAGGLVELPGGSEDAGESVGVTSDGGVVVGGSFEGCEDSLGFILRHSPDGSIDDDFGGDRSNCGGLTTAGITPLPHPVHGVAVDGEDRILAVGEDFDGDTGDIGVVRRLLPDGSSDRSFGTEGEGVIQIDAPGRRLRLNAVTVDSVGRIVIVGTAEGVDQSPDNEQLIVLRLLSDGRSDPSFNGNAPRLLGSPTAAAEGRAVAVEPDGQIVVVGANVPTPFVPEPCCADMLVFRLNEDGAPDTSFAPDNGETGVRPERIGDALNRATGVAVKPDGRIVVAGFAADFGDLGQVAEPPYAVALQLRPDGTRDPSFGDNGLFTTEGRVSAIVGGVAVDEAGNAVIAGSGGQIGDLPEPRPEADDVVVVRVDPSGAFDAGFGSNGVVWTDLGGVEAANGVALAPDGRIVIGGSNDDPRGLRVLAARYHAGTAVEQPEEPGEPEQPEEPGEPEQPEDLPDPPAVFAPSIAFNPAVGRAGETTVVTGAGFPPGAVVGFDWSQGIDSVPPLTAGPDGGFTVAVLVLPSEILGNRVLTATSAPAATGGPLGAGAAYLVTAGTSQPGDFVGRR